MRHSLKKMKQSASKEEKTNGKVLGKRRSFVGRPRNISQYRKTLSEKILILDEKKKNPGIEGRTCLKESPNGGRERVTQKDAYLLKRREGNSYVVRKQEMGLSAELKTKKSVYLEDKEKIREKKKKKRFEEKVKKVFSIPSTRRRGISNGGKRVINRIPRRLGT